MKSGRLVAIALLAGATFVASCRPVSDVTTPGPHATRWWKGNTHTHSFWSDGNDYPEMVADWYRRNGYDFLVLTDHNTLANEDRWIRVPATGEGRESYEKYRKRFGEPWVEERRTGDTLSVRLKRTQDYRTNLEQSGRFLLIPGEEITQYLGRKAAHVNAINIAELVEEQRGATLVEILASDLAVVREQERRTGRNIIAVLNHPNFLWSQTAENLLQLDSLRFFEVYNGHPLVNTLGDALHASTERIWDIVLTGRARRGSSLLLGVATDDAHDYHAFGPQHRNPGRGWIMVRAQSLTPDALTSAMERGDFYSSTGVTLTEVRHTGRQLTLSIRGDTGVTYVTQFIGTRAGYDTTSVAVHDTAGTPLTRRYSPSIGAILAEVRGTTPSYTMRGDELYVRARVISSRPKANASYGGEVEMAWTQPVRP